MNLSLIKGALASKTIWGGLIAIAGSILGISSSDQAELVRIASEVMTIGGSLLAIYGRTVATKAIRGIV